MEGRGSRELSWLIQGNGNISIKAGAPHCGQAESTLSLQ
jgi:hypothetical protein